MDYSVSLCIRYHFGKYTFKIFLHSPEKMTEKYLDVREKVFTLI